MRRKSLNPRSPWHKLFIFATLICALYGGYYWGSLHGPNRMQLQALSRLAEPAALRPFRLKDHDDQPFTGDHLNNHWNLVIFGYSEDDQLTPQLLTLARLVMNRLADRPKLQEQTRLIMITLDPASDTPERLAPFVARYGTHFLALTGEQTEIAGIAAQLGVTFRSQQGESGRQRIDHSSSIALIDPAGRLIGLFTGLVDTSSIANDIKLLADEEKP